MAASFANQLLSSRIWTEKIPEQNLWEGTVSRKKYLIPGDPHIPIQPTRIPIQLLKEIMSQLNSLGVDLLNRDLVLGTMKSCRESIAAVYSDMMTEISDIAALQLLADTVFLEIALSGQEIGEFNPVKEKLVVKVFLCLNSLISVP